LKEAAKEKLKSRVSRALFLRNGKTTYLVRVVLGYLLAFAGGANAATGDFFLGGLSVLVAMVFFPDWGEATELVELDKGGERRSRQR